MNNQDLYKAARGYWIANAVVGSAASKMAQLNREQEAKIAEITSFYSHYQSEKQLADRIGTYIVCNLCFLLSIQLSHLGGRPHNGL